MKILFMIINFDILRDKLRGKLIHKIFVFLKYNLLLIIVYRFYYSLRKKRIKKCLYFIILSILNSFRKLPKCVGIDLVSCCNLKCPLCSVPPFITKRRENFMSFEDFTKIIDKLNIVSDICLVYAGEPLLHPKFFDMVKYVNDRFYTMCFTNGTLLNKRKISNVLDSGLDFLTISFDGFSKESYEKYRVGAKYDSVKRNILNLIEAKKEKKSGLPHLTINYLVNAYNEDEVDDCKKFFMSAGANRFFSKSINLNIHRRIDNKKEDDLSNWLPKKSGTTLYEQKDNKISFKKRNQICSACLTPIIRCDGEILICCHDIFNTVKIGNIFNHDFKSLWFSDHYKKMRKLGKTRKHPMCFKCGK